MQKLNPPMLAACGTLLIICALGLSLYVSGVGYQTPDEITSISEEKPTDTDISEQNLTIAAQVQIDETNVQQVIRSLLRPETYTAYITSQLYYGDSYGAVSCKQYVNQNAYRVDYLNSNGEIDYSEIQFKDVCYTFSAGANSFKQMPSGKFSTDVSAMMPTYETVLELPQTAITGSRMYEENGQMLIEIDTKIDNNIAIYRISLKNGLLYSADFSQNGKMTRKVIVQAGENMPEAKDFILPGQSKPIYEM